jgi:hypothetical protein
MTALSMMYTGNGFLIAADGRCRSDNPESVVEKTRETDQAQKIFPVETDTLKMAYALVGFASNEDGSFETVAELAKQVKLLEMSRFSNGYQYIHRFCQNIKRAVMKARTDGRITEFPNNDHLELEEKGRIFRLVFLGYFNGLAFWREAKFYHDEQLNTIDVRPDDVEIIRHLRCIGPEEIARSMYEVGIVPDPRIAMYRKNRSDGDLEYTASFIRACSDPIALEIDPVCKDIGGHI